ncbi:hypothetical protein [Aeromicrobium sp. HA]|uniref:hypothetical protein n=1 Tax=Aeromicrobium sp. HA TaxID=3009077 RepID=UPI0022AFDEEE|nr:hypothetical protein [Aeromicrobium sp. HA]
MTERTLPVVPGVEHRWIDVDGVSLHVAEAGEAHRSADRPPSCCCTGGRSTGSAGDT